MKAAPFNTSLLYFADDDLKDYYTEESIRFMLHERGTLDNGSWCMVFAERREFYQSRT